jgi:hypothetical protein
MLNRENFLFQSDVERIRPLLVPTYAITASVKKDAGGYWLNVQWKCGVTAPLTIQELDQALGERKC